MPLTQPLDKESSLIPGLRLFRRGKVRDVYDLGDELLMVASDRLSAFDHILPTPIPGKGAILTAMSAFWFRKTAGLFPNHFITDDREEIQKKLRLDAELPAAMLVQKAERLDVECVARGYLAGSAWKEYRATGTVCGLKLPAGLEECSRLPEPLFTPATKADTGHDQNISQGQLAALVGNGMAEKLKAASLALYRFAADHLEARGLRLADTKFEFGLRGGRLIAIDEMVTPDSSRIWDAAARAPGRAPESFDKQFVRDHLERSGWDKNPPAPALPEAVVRGTAARYEEALRRITS